MIAIWKRFRISLYFVLVIVIPFFFISSEEMPGWWAALVMFVFVPGWFISLIWALWRAVRDIFCHFIHGEPLPDNEPIWEVTFIQSVGEWFVDRFDMIRDMSSKMRLRFFLLAFGGIILSLGGLAIIIICMFSPLLIGVGTVILILGIACIKLSNPDSFNESSSNITMYDNVKHMTLDDLYDCVKNVMTPFGNVRRAMMINAKEPCLAWEMNDDHVVIVYTSLHDEAFYVYYAESFSIKEYLSEAKHDTSRPDESVGVDSMSMYYKINLLLEDIISNGEFDEDLLAEDENLWIDRSND